MYYSLEKQVDFINNLNIILKKWWLYFYLLNINYLCLRNNRVNDILFILTIKLKFIHMAVFNIDYTPWYHIYHQIALELQKFYNIHKGKSSIELYILLEKSSFFRMEESWLKNVRLYSRSVDPIQFFTSFSKSGQTGLKSAEIIEEVWRIFKKEEPYWNFIDFDGRPAPVALKIESVRNEVDQKQIWECLDNILTNNKKGLSESLWQEAISWRGIRAASFTIFLFWIDSDNFIPLDNNTQQYLIHLGYLDLNTTLNFTTYSKLLEYRRIRNYPVLSFEAYKYLHLPDQYHQETPHNSNKHKNTGIKSGFKLLGLKTLERNAISHKVLKPHTFYSFDNYYEYIEVRKGIESFKVDFSKFDSLYDIKDRFKVNISAIVGKNGSGKSTLIDLILMGIYNLSLQMDFLKEGTPLEGLGFELYWMADKIYKLTFLDEIKLYAFKEVEDKKNTTIYELESNPINIKKNIVAFFYSILINYSHYALNSSEREIDWITPLSHKNDGYKTPIVINPKRTNGNINVNREKELMNIRLLVNLLELHDLSNIKQSFRHIDESKTIKYFSIHLDQNKCDTIKSELADNITYGDPIIRKLIIEELNSVFQLEENNTQNRYQEEIEYYIVGKVYNIINTYEFYINKYQRGIGFWTKELVATQIDLGFHEIELNFRDRLNDLFEDIKKDPSHISIKFKQAVSFLKFAKLQSFINNNIDKVEIGTKIDLDDYNDLIVGIGNDYQSEDISTIDLLPPPIFKIEFYIDDKDESNFNQASSGEYQLLSVLSSILYHIRNVDSVENQYSYRYITILLDEVELYFHPNMQRSFIKKLLLALSKLDCNIWGVHVLFATHSPFILSDILQQKILKISHGEPLLIGNNYNSFAANIHDLLADEFFLENGNMGAFATQQIEIAINLLNYIRIEKEISNSSEKFHSESLLNYKTKLCELGYWSESTFNIRNLESERKMVYNLIEIVGEPIIKHKLSQMYQIAFDEPINRKREDIEAEILQLAKDYKIDLKKIL